MTRGRALMRKTKKRKHYGAITAKDYAVLGALLFQFANWTTGFCFPSYETIAEVAGCSRSHVAVAIKRLEAAGLLTWVNRLKWSKSAASISSGATACKNARCAPRTATDFSIQGRPRSHNFYPSPKFRREPQTRILFLR